VNVPRSSVATTGSDASVLMNCAARPKLKIDVSLIVTVRHRCRRGRFHDTIVDEVVVDATAAGADLAELHRSDELAIDLRRRRAEVAGRHVRACRGGRRLALLLASAVGVTAASTAVASTPAVTGLLRFTLYQLPRYRRTSR